MKRIMMKTNEVVHSLSVVETLRRRKIGTNSMERLTEKLCGGNGREAILEIVMKKKLKEAYKIRRKVKYERRRVWREEDDLLIKEGVLEGFYQVLPEFK